MIAAERRFPKARGLSGEVQAASNHSRIRNHVQQKLVISQVRDSSEARRLVGAWRQPARLWKDRAVYCRFREWVPQEQGEHPQLQTMNKRKPRTPQNHFNTGITSGIARNTASVVSIASRTSHTQNSRVAALKRVLRFSNSLAIRRDGSAEANHRIPQ